MRDVKMRNSGVRGVCLIAITYVYFLIFAQFAFLARLAECGIAGEHLNSIMAAMAAGGVLLSLLTPRVQLLSSSVLRLRLGLTVAGIAALLACLRLGEAEALLVAFLIGAGLGLLTVTLVSDLMRWIGDSNPLLKIALGTGVGYLLCNLPQLFTASATAQAITAAVLCGAGIFATTGETAPGKPIEISVVHSEIRFPHVLLCFTALVWLDSAAFYIIQHTEPLKAGTWQGSAHLWMNASLHFGGAMLGAVLLKRKGVGFVLCAAFLVLAAACLLLLDPQRALTASLFYPIGVSLYSVALVAYPSLLASPTHRRWMALRCRWLGRIGSWYWHGQESWPYPCRFRDRRGRCDTASPAVADDQTAYARVPVGLRGSASGFRHPSPVSFASSQRTPLGCGTRQTCLYLGRLHSLPFAVCAPAYSGR